MFLMAKLLYPIGIQNFREIREGGYVYVDKTAYIHELATVGKYYFLSRPRRFGKSLLLSTIEELFKGERYLFKGLYIYDHWDDWTLSPVIHLDLTGTNFNSPDSLRKHLDSFLTAWEQKCGIVPLYRDTLGLRFGNLIAELHNATRQRVVILVDEYDKPLLETIDRPDLQEQYRADLRAFYSNLKSQDSHIRFAMLTGVARFGHLSIFSDLNNLQDISMDDSYAGICGITNDELLNYFKDGVSEFASSSGLSFDEAVSDLKDNYDGYHFSPFRRLDIYNPFSLLNCLSKKRIGNYWFRTGTPSFLIKLVRKRNISPKKLDNLSIPLDDVDNVSFNLSSSLYPLLYQSGYLTIKSYRPEVRTVLLGFPNREVEEGFLKDLMQVSISHPNEESGFSIAEFYDDVMGCNPEKFMQRLQCFFADFNREGFNHIKLEQHYQDVTYMLFKLLGFLTHIEYRTATGRINTVIKTPGCIYVMEFKIESTAEEAMSQIDSNDYMLPFKVDGRTLIKIGANFSNKDRNLDSWLIIEE